MSMLNFAAGRPARIRYLSGSYKLLDVHVLFNGNMHLSHVHAVCDELEEKIRAELGTFDILIHPEPAGDHKPESKERQYEESQSPTEPAETQKFSKN